MSDLFSNVFPTLTQEYILKASLSTDRETVRNNLHLWKQQEGPSSSDLGTIRMFPLLYLNLKRHQIRDSFLEKLHPKIRRNNKSDGIALFEKNEDVKEWSIVLYFFKDKNYCRLKSAATKKALLNEQGFYIFHKI